MKVKDDHLTTIGGDIVASHLDHTGYRNMAAFVRQLDRSVSAANKRADEFLEQANVLAARLKALQPEEKGHDPRPPAEASD